MLVSSQTLLGGVALLAAAGGLGFLLGLRLGRRGTDRKVMDLRRALTSVEAANRGLQAAMGSLEQAAGSDRLTGAWNRRRFEEAAHAEIALSRRRDLPVTLLMLDLDHFKRVNDTFGHETGDAVLAGASRAWRDVLRTSDPLVRWGGEEFIVMTPGNALEGGLVLATKLLEATRCLDFPGLDPVSVSIGVAELAAGESLESWIQRADLALYQAKSQGRDQACAAEAPPPEAMTGLPGSERPLVELPWEDAYACGHPLLDAQHHQLFDLANRLLASLTLGLPREEIALHWNRMVAHAAQHFHDEERILHRHGFVLLNQHAEEHQRLLALAKALEADILAGTADLGQVVNFLATDLVRGHLMNEDAVYFHDLLATTRTPTA